ncbi:MAG: hypothetical protein H7222_05855 [Methylotenera sp.]|nr:hypothetical protein [Oligoflexia bacterium]
MTQDLRLLNDSQLLTQYAETEIVKRASVLACECPSQLVLILARIREFQTYEQNCILKSEKDRETHEWLYDQAINLDQMLSATIIQLARLEGMVDSENRIVEHPVAN